MHLSAIHNEHLHTVTQVLRRCVSGVIKFVTVCRHTKKPRIFECIVCVQFNILGKKKEF